MSEPEPEKPKKKRKRIVHYDEDELKCSNPPKKPNLEERIRECQERLARGEPLTDSLDALPRE